MKTPAIVFTDAGKVDLLEIEMPEPRAYEVQIRTEVSFISVGTERWVFKNEFSWQPTRFPSVPGYQRVGIVTKLGSGVTELKVGDRVMATVGAWDGATAPFWGSHVGVANSSVDQVFKLPDQISSVNASGAVVAQVGYNAASRLSFESGDWVLIFGDGLIGQCAAQAARAMGGRTILVGRRDARLQLAAAHSAEFVINSRITQVEEQVRTITGNSTVGAVVDTIQGEEVQRVYMPLLRREPPAQIVYAGFSQVSAWADMAALQKQECTCHFVSGWKRSRMESTLRLLADGSMSLEPFVTHRGSYKMGPQFYEMLLANKEPYLGIVIDWSDNRQ